MEIVDKTEAYEILKKADPEILSVLRKWLGDSNWVCEMGDEDDIFALRYHLGEGNSISYINRSWNDELAWYYDKDQRSIMMGCGTGRIGMDKHIHVTYKNGDEISTYWENGKRLNVKMRFERRLLSIDVWNTEWRIHDHKTGEVVQNIYRKPNMLKHTGYGMRPNSKGKMTLQSIKTWVEFDKDSASILSSKEGRSEKIANENGELDGPPDFLGGQSFWQTILNLLSKNKRLGNSTYRDFFDKLLTTFVIESYPNSIEEVREIESILEGDIPVTEINNIKREETNWLPSLDIKSKDIDKILRELLEEGEYTVKEGTWKDGFKCQFTFENGREVFYSDRYWDEIKIVEMNKDIKTEVEYSAMEDDLSVFTSIKMTSASGNIYIARRDDEGAMSSMLVNLQKRGHIIRVENTTFEIDLGRTDILQYRYSTGNVLKHISVNTLKSDKDNGGERVVKTWLKFKRETGEISSLKKGTNETTAIEADVSTGIPNFFGKKGVLEKLVKLLCFVGPLKNGRHETFFGNLAVFYDLDINSEAHDEILEVLDMVYLSKQYFKN